MKVAQAEAQEKGDDRSNEPTGSARVSAGEESSEGLSNLILDRKQQP